MTPVPRVNSIRCAKMFIVTPLTWLTRMPLRSIAVPTATWPVRTRAAAPMVSSCCSSSDRRAASAVSSRTCWARLPDPSRLRVTVIPGRPSEIGRAHV